MRYLKAAAILVVSLAWGAVGPAHAQNIVKGFTANTILHASDLNTMQQALVSVAGGSSVNQTLTTPNLLKASLTSPTITQAVITDPAVSGGTVVSNLSGSTLEGLLTSDIARMIGPLTWQTWSPTLLLGGSNAGMLITVTPAGYYKSGNTVKFWASLRLIYKGSATGAVTITGLPYAALGSFNFPVDLVANGLASSGTEPRAIISGSTISIYTGSAVNDQAMQATDADLENAAVLNVSGEYPVEDSSQ